MRANELIAALQRAVEQYGDLKEVRFYMQPMDEETFQERAATLTDVVVYALHKLS